MSGTKTSNFTLLLALATASIALHFAKLTQESYWTDELFSMNALREGVWNWVYQHEASPPLYFCLLKCYSLLFGTSVLALRGFSAVLGGLSAPLFVLCARTWRCPPRVAWIAGVLLALNPLLFWQSQQVRYYALLHVIGILWLASFPSLGTARRGRLGVWFIVLSFLGFATHYYFGFYLLAACAAGFGWLLVSRDRDHGRVILVHFLVLALALLPLLPLLVHQLRSSPASYLQPPDVAQFASVFLRYFWMGPWVEGGGWTFSTLTWRTGCVAVIIALTLIGWYWELCSREHSRLLVPLLGLAFVPMVAAFFVSRWLTPIFIADRYPLLFLPPFLLACVLGWNAWPNRMRKGALTVGCMATAALAIGSLTIYWTHFQEFDWRGAGALIEREWHAGDAAVFCPGWLRGTFENNGGSVPHVLTTDTGALGNCSRVWLFMWEQAPADSGRPQLELFRASAHPEPRIVFPHMTLTLLHPSGP